MQLDVNRVVQLLTEKVGASEARESMQRAYAELLEQRVKELEAQVIDMATRNGSQVVGEANSTPID
jgi:hypothetical protein